MRAFLSVRGRRWRRAGLLVLLLSMSRPAAAQVFGTVRVVARDQQNLAIANAVATISSKSSTWVQTANTNGDGEAIFAAVPLGAYTISVTAAGFEASTREVAVTSNSVTPVQLRMAVAGLAQSVEVAAEIQTINPESSRTGNLVDRLDILHQPDADRSGSLAMITNNTPGAYMMHDHLHSRGGHGVGWQIDGVPVPNSNLASVGAQFDPKDVDSLEVNRGGLSANYGDRSYGVFNVVPRSGFDGDKFGDLALTYGSYRLANGYLSLGDHTGDQRLAYFASGSANRTDRGLERVDVPILHDRADAYAGFTSIIFNPSHGNQLRYVGAARTDRYQVPNTSAQDLIGIRDREVATDAFSNFTWVHTSDAGTLLTVSPYYHYNRGQYLGGESDPLVTYDDRRSHYLGGYVNLAVPRGKHTIRMGTESFCEKDNSVFGLTANEGARLSLTEREVLWASVAAAFVEDTFRVNDALTVNGGVRVERFAGSLSEHATTPRAGAAVTIPHIGILRASYGRYYQHPQTSTISGPLLQFALEKGFDYLPVPGERDEVFEIGLGIPARGWTIDLDGYENRTKNAVDHEVLGNSNLLFPLTIDRGRVRAVESTLRSPRLFRRLHVRYAVAYQIAQGRGGITGGLTDFQPPAGAYFFLDHDQRVTLTTGAELNLPARVWTSANVIYGSGFLKGNGPDHMPRHTTLDLAVGKEFGEKLELRLSSLNVTNALFLTGFENSFAGTHYANPREVTVQARYKFHF